MNEQDWDVPPKFGTELIETRLSEGQGVRGTMGDPSLLQEDPRM